jgi:hypothetical protein
MPGILLNAGHQTDQTNYSNFNNPALRLLQTPQPCCSQDLLESSTAGGQQGTEF